MLKKYCICVALLFLFSLSLAAKINADTVQLASTGTAIDFGQSNSKGNTIAVAPNPNWAAPLIWLILRILWFDRQSIKSGVGPSE